MNEEHYLLLSGIQHFSFCPRQWALVHLEDQWADNWRTTSGNIMHERVHNGKIKEKRGDCLTVRALKIVSHSLALVGECDVVEFLRDENGVELHGETDKYRPFPVEYKRGKAKPHDADVLQLCAQAIALEEMLCCEIACGALFYGEPHRRTDVEFTPALREQTRQTAAAMHDVFARGVTPKPKAQKHCASCSLQSACVPKLPKKQTVQAYLAEYLED